MRRAKSVKEFLQTQSIEPERIYTDGKGELEPLANNKTRDGRAQNRRVEIEVVGVRQR
jgi:OOP family OmpA-OmpF porin